MAANQVNGLLPPVGMAAPPPPAPGIPLNNNNDDMNYYDMNTTQAVINPEPFMYPYEGDRADLDAFLTARIQRAWNRDAEGEALFLEAVQKIVAGQNLTQRERADIKNEVKYFQTKCKNIIDENLQMLQTNTVSEQSGREKLYIFYELFQCLNKSRKKVKQFELPGLRKPNEPPMPDFTRQRIQRGLRELKIKLAEYKREWERIDATVAAKPYMIANHEFFIRLLDQAQIDVNEGKAPLEPVLNQFKYFCEAKVRDGYEGYREVINFIGNVQDIRKVEPVPELDINNLQNTRFLERIEQGANEIVEKPLVLPEPKGNEAAKAVLSVPPDAPTTDMGPEARGRVEQKLIQCFFENWKRMENKPEGTQKEFLTYIRKLLVDNGAVIAGGFVLKTILGETDRAFVEWHKVSDIDIYVPCNKLHPFNLIWAKLLGATQIVQFKSSLYCVSFLRKNGIRGVQKLIGETSEECEITEVDIMAVRNSRRVLDVVQTFDLTFCQVWYDGRTVTATHPTHIKERVGYLQKDYVPLYVAGNDFLMNRVSKYKTRGFYIQLEPNSGTSFESYISDIDPMSGQYHRKKNRPGKQARDDAFFKRWAAHACMEYCLSGTYEPLSSTKFLQGILDKATNIELIKKRHQWGAEQLGTLDTLSYLHPTDGYDSEEVDIEQKETFYPLIEEGFRRGKFDLPQLQTQPSESKWYHIVFKFYSELFSPFSEVNLFVDEAKSRWYINDPDYQGIHRSDYRVPEFFQRLFGPNFFGPYLDILKSVAYNIQDDPITLDEAKCFHLHEHTLEQGIPVQSLVDFLNTDDKIKQYNKTSIKCYIDECRKPLTMTEIHAVIMSEIDTPNPPDFYDTFASKKELVPNHTPLNNSVVQYVSQNPDDPHVKAGVLEIFQNVKSRANTYGDIFHYVMCPFCLEYIKREAGCIYVKHDNPGEMRVSPYCKPNNVVQEIVDKYTGVINAMVAAARTPEQRIMIETVLLTCAECGRPCVGHKHFTSTDPIAPIPSPGYSRCTGGGRREQIARILAVRKTMRENPDEAPKELRRLCALAADVAPNDADLLAKADTILALPPDQRHTNQIDEVLDGRPPTPYVAPAPAGAAPAAAPVPAPGAAAGGARRIGKPYTCSHGFTDGYKEKIKHTRKHTHTKSRMTRKV